MYYIFFPNPLFEDLFCHFVFVEKDFLDLLPLSQQCTEEEDKLLHFLFENKLKKVRPLLSSVSGHQLHSDSYVKFQFFTLSFAKLIIMLCFYVGIHRASNVTLDLAL